MEIRPVRAALIHAHIKDRQKIITKLKLRSSGNTLERTKISSTPRRKLEITPGEASTRFSRLQQNHLKVARLKDTGLYSKINHKLLVCQLFPAALLLTYQIAIILQPRKYCFARGVFQFPQKNSKKEETRLVKNITTHIELSNHQFQGLKLKKNRPFQIFKIIVIYSRHNQFTST